MFVSKISFQFLYVFFGAFIYIYIVKSILNNSIVIMTVITLLLNVLVLKYENTTFIK